MEEKKNILIADDDGTIRNALAAVLQTENYDVRLAENGRVAVRQFLQRRPDLILLDLNMPRMDGRETLAAIKTDDALKAIPVVILTTSGAAPDIVSSYQH
ncbi:MAG TPA: response regulator, partial [Verrucomicrobiae bacterium]|nr:response regulator [Verrucomicrobiae bacterium]